MSTLLQLVNYTREECDAAGAGDLLTVASVTGESLRFKNWVIRAWEELQESRDSWLWMKGAYSFVTTANSGSYTAAQAGIATRFGRFDRLYCTVYLTSVGVSNQTPLEWMGYELFRDTYLTGVQNNMRPLHFSVGYSNELLLGPAPESTLYTIAGQYYKSPQTLAADGDIPELPDQHRVIVYRAMKKYARFNVSPEIYSEASAQDQAITCQLEIKYLPEIKFA